jgi:hypothetical protein
VAQLSTDIHHTFRSKGGSEILIVISQTENSIEVFYKLREGEAVRIDRITLAELADLFGDADKMLEPPAPHDIAENTLPQET